MAFDGGGLMRGELAIAKKNSSLTLNKYSLFHFNGIFIGYKGTVNVSRFWFILITICSTEYPPFI